MSYIKRFSNGDYEKVTEWIFNLKAFGDVKLRLKVMEDLLENIGSPQKRLKVIHVGGTNGKGSTVTMIASILSEAGYKVGAFTKPHMTNFTERISINGDQIPEERVVEMINDMMPAIEKTSGRYNHPTFFEITAALMMKYFADEDVDFAVIEVGMGGRLDATNTVDSLVSVITNVSLEHTAILGDTIAQIAGEKAGIIKKNGILVTSAEGDALEVFRKVCEEKNARIIVVGEDITFEKVRSDTNGQMFNVETFNRNFDNVELSLIGEHQLTNASLAIGAIEALGIHDIIVPDGAVYSGLVNVRWPGRMEIVQKHPYVVLDGAKDMLATKKVTSEIQSLFDYDKLVSVVSISKGKKIGDMMRDISSISDYMILTRHGVRGRAVSPEDLSEHAYGKKFEIVDNIRDAVARAIEVAGKDGLVFVSGSIFTVGEAREIWHRKVDFHWGRELNES